MLSNWIAPGPAGWGPRHWKTRTRDLGAAPGSVLRERLGKQRLEIRPHVVGDGARAGRVRVRTIGLHQIAVADDVHQDERHHREVVSPDTPAFTTSYASPASSSFC